MSGTQLFTEHTATGCILLLYAPGPNGVINSVPEVLTFGFWQPQDFLHNQYLALPAIMLIFFIIVLCLTIFQRRMVSEDRKAG